MGGFVLCGGAERRDHPLKGGWSHSLPVGDSGGGCFLFSVVLAGGVRLCKIEMLFTYARCTRYSLGYSRDMQGDICEIYMYDVCSGYEEFAAAVAARCCWAACCCCCSLLLLLLTAAAVTAAGLLQSLLLLLPLL